MISKNEYTAYHHFVSQFYLRKFCNAGKLTIFDINNGSVSYKPTKKVCGEYDFFTLDGVSEFLQGKNLTEFYHKGVQMKSSLIEEAFSKLETKASLCFKKIVQNESLDNLTNEEFYDFIEWLAWIYIANPKNKHFFKNKHPEGSNTSLCGGFISLHMRIVPFFWARSWRLAYSDQALLTSDCPVSLVSNVNVVNDFNVLSKSCIIFPVTRNLLLMGDVNTERQVKVFSATRKLKPDFSLQANAIIHDNAKLHLIAYSQQDINNYYDTRLKKIYVMDLIKVLKEQQHVI